MIFVLKVIENSSTMKKTDDNRVKRSKEMKTASRIRNIIDDSSFICKIVELVSIKK